MKRNIVRSSQSTKPALKHAQHPEHRNTSSKQSTDNTAVNIKPTDFSFRKLTKVLLPADYVLILIILAGCFFLFFSSNTSRADKVASIYLSNTLFGEYPLSQDQVIVINKHCTAQISQGKIRMRESDCPDNRCVKTGWTDKAPIICLPNQVVIEITNSKQDKQLHLLY
jgi:hypothetical protein